MFKKTKKNAISLRLNNQQRKIMTEALEECMEREGGVKKFCDQQGITTQTYYDWKKRHIPIFRAMELSKKYDVEIDRLFPIKFFN